MLCGRMMFQEVPFTKMHGLGNDFVIVDKQHVQDWVNLKELATAVSDRHTGIGCDQFIIYQPVASSHYQMLIYNQDGSSAKMCGNAARCLAKLIHLNYQQQRITIHVGEKMLVCSVKSNNMISVNVGAVSFNESWMISADKFWPIAERYVIDRKEALCVDVGNPHLVIFSEFNTQDQAIIGEKLQAKELFVDGVNVNFATVKDNKIYLSVWERGTGPTLACGSGACATFAAAVKLGFVHSPAEIVFKLGSLTMSQDGNQIIMTGSASLVATGMWYTNV